MDQGGLFDGRKERDAGIDRAISANEHVFLLAKRCAVTLGKKKGIVTIDDVQEMLEGMGLSSEDLGQAAGGVFRGSRWKKIGTQQTRRASSHARDVSVWEYQDE